MAFNKTFLVMLFYCVMSFNALVKALNGKGGFVDDTRFIKRIALLSVAESLIWNMQSHLIQMALSA